MRAFLATHASLILRLARRVVGERGGSIEPSDVAQEVFVALLQTERAGTFDPARIENADAYLRVVVRNAAHRARSRRKLLEHLADDGDLAGVAEEAARLDAEPLPDPEELTRRAHDARRALEALKRKLRPRDALALALLVEEGLDAEEVAERLGTTLNNVYQMRHRILAAARELFGKDEPRRALDPQRGVP